MLLKIVWDAIIFGTAHGEDVNKQLTLLSRRKEKIDQDHKNIHKTQSNDKNYNIFSNRFDFFR
jgi:hypothetical protein